MMRYTLIWALCLTVLPCFSVAQSASSAPIATLRYLDRTTGEQGDASIGVGQKAQLGSLEVMIEDCRYPRGSISSDAFAYLSIYESTADKIWFDGWMVASSPALNALDHPRYDVWVLNCKTS